ncbi:MAG: sce7725 family protein [Mucilaginibacter sp.]
MYFPYLRGKQFELEALLEVNPNVYQNTIPILEPITLARRRLYSNLTTQNIPLILVTNPFYSRTRPLTAAQIQNVIDNELSTHNSLVLGFIIDQRFDIADLNTFLTANATRRKAIILRNNPIPTNLTAIQSLIGTHSVDYIIFDEVKTTPRTRAFFSSHPQRVLLTDGFQRQERNADYPLDSAFDSIYDSWATDGWFGTGDYLTIGDFFRDGGGQAYVVTLHVTVPTLSGILIHHFSSTSYSTSPTFPALKFSEANRLLNTSTAVIPLNSNGLTLYRNWHIANFFPGLGAAKKASIMHHIELMSTLV